jgi:hypothetical protein
MDKKANNNTDKSTGKESTKGEVLVITGDPKKDLKSFRKSKDYEYGIKLIEFYAPKNLNLIEYFKTKKDINYLEFNLKIITNARC